MLQIIKFEFQTDPTANYAKWKMINSNVNALCEVDSVIPGRDDARTQCTVVLGHWQTRTPERKYH